MQDKSAIAIGNSGRSLDEELFRCILGVACRVIREEQSGCEFNVENVCKGTMAVSTVGQSQKLTHDLGAAFLVKTIVNCPDGAETSVDFFLPEQARHLFPRLESFDAGLPMRRQRRENHLYNLYN